MRICRPRHAAGTAISLRYHVERELSFLKSPTGGYSTTFPLVRDTGLSVRMEKALSEADIVPEYRHLVVNDEADAAAEEIHGLLNRRKKTRMPREDALELTKQIQADLRNFLQEEENCDKIN